MKISKTIAATPLRASLLAPAIASAAVIGGTTLCVAVRLRRVLLRRRSSRLQGRAGRQSLPGSDMGTVARDLLPAMQAAKPRPALTFAYDVAPVKDQPNYRLVLVFDAANDLGSREVCNGISRVKPGRPGLFKPRPSTAATTWRCRRRRPGRRPAASSIRISPSCSASCSWSCCPISHAMKPQVGGGNRN